MDRHAADYDRYHAGPDLDEDVGHDSTPDPGAWVGSLEDADAAALLVSSTRPQPCDPVDAEAETAAEAEHAAWLEEQRRAEYGDPADDLEWDDPRHGGRERF